ncbi:MAG: four helix bundle protein [Gemmatimonadaceae bacterium]|nr:four helix bundle protein [Gemmatimonadaceae bacterium]
MDIALLSELAAWEATLSPADTADPLWKLHAYRVSRYLLDRCLVDIQKASPPLHVQTADQLRRATASVSANLAEGYSRRTANDRLRFYSYALGSLRETTVWYLSVRAHLPADALQARIDLIAQARRLVLGLHAHVARTGGWKPRIEREAKGE